MSVNKRYNALKLNHVVDNFAIWCFLLLDTTLGGQRVGEGEYNIWMFLTYCLLSETARERVLLLIKGQTDKHFSCVNLSENG